MSSTQAVCPAFSKHDSIFQKSAVESSSADLQSSLDDEKLNETSSASSENFSGRTFPNGAARNNKRVHISSGSHCSHEKAKLELRSESQRLIRGK